MLYLVTKGLQQTYQATMDLPGYKYIKSILIRMKNATFLNKYNSISKLVNKLVYF